MIAALLAFLLVQTETLAPAQAEERLVAWSAADFATHLPGRVRGFRSVHAARLRHPEGVERPLLCGEAQVEDPDGSLAWTAFATLETRSGYEQWLGGSAATWCHPATDRDVTRDLSDRLGEALARHE